MDVYYIAQHLFILPIKLTCKNALWVRIGYDSRSCDRRTLHYYCSSVGTVLGVITALPIVNNSDLYVDASTMFCLLENHKVRARFKNTRVPECDRLVLLPTSNVVSIHKTAHNNLVTSG
jgi:hypothetical protein